MALQRLAFDCCLELSAVLVITLAHLVTTAIMMIAIMLPCIMAMTAFLFVGILGLFLPIPIILILIPRFSRSRASIKCLQSSSVYSANYSDGVAVFRTGSSSPVDLSNSRAVSVPP